MNHPDSHTEVTLLNKIDKVRSLSVIQQSYERRNRNLTALGNSSRCPYLDKTSIKTKMTFVELFMSL